MLSGLHTHERKYFDWEIKTTLDKKHGLIGVWLPSFPLSRNGGTVNLIVSKTIFIRDTPNGCDGTLLQLTWWKHNRSSGRNCSKTYWQ